jgi:hypothetical protein
MNGPDMRKEIGRLAVLYKFRGVGKYKVTNKTIDEIHFPTPWIVWIEDSKGLGHLITNTPLLTFLHLFRNNSEKKLVGIFGPIETEEIAISISNSFKSQSRGSIVDFSKNYPKYQLFLQNPNGKQNHE